MNVYDRIIPLKDGREIQVIEAGQLDGIPILVHNGTPGSRLHYHHWIEDAQSQGKAVFINFWYAACRYCQYEMPNIQRMYDTYAEDGLVVLGVNVGNSQQAAADYAKRLKITFPNLLDMDELINGVYLVIGYPASFFVDREGVINSIYIGELIREEMEKHVKQVLK